MLDKFLGSDFMKSGQGYSLFSGMLGSAVTNSLSDLANYESRTRPNLQQNHFNTIPMLALGGIGVSNNRMVEVEGGEVKQDKFGNVIKYRGASHQQGGIQTTIQQGDIVFSDKLKIDGKTLAERKIAREKLLKKLSKLSTGDKVSKASNERIRANLLKQEQSDLAYQAQFNQQNQQKLAYGTQPPPSWFNYQSQYSPYHVGDTTFLTKDPILQLGSNAMNIQPLPKSGLNNFLLDVPGFGLPQGFDHKTPKLPTTGIQPLQTPTPPQFQQAQDNLTGFKGGDVDPIYQKTLGDFIGQAGTVFGGIAPLANTINNRMGDQPNINPFKGYGTEGLQNNRNIEMLLSQQRDIVYNDIAAQEAASRDRMRGSARGLNTLRALDTNTDNLINKAQMQANQAFTNQMMNVLNQRTGLLNSRDQMVMQGNATRDMNDRRDRDIFHSNLGQNLANIANKTQEYGANENIARSNKDKLELLNSMSSYGFKYTNDGIIQTKNGEPIHKMSKDQIATYAKDLKGKAKEIFYSDVNIARKKEGLPPVKSK